MEINTGIYQVLNTANGKRYIGSAVNTRARWGLHKRQLNTGQHHSRYLQRAWDKHGEESFKFSLLFICTKHTLLFYEQRALDGFRPEYNVCSVAGSTLGVKHTSEARINMSISHIGKKRGPHSYEHKVKIGDANRGRKHTDEARAKMSEAHRTENLSAETRAKMSDSASGKKHSDETRAKMSDAHRGKKKSPEHAAKVGMAHRGRKHTDEARANMSAGAKRRWAKQKAQP